MAATQGTGRYHLVRTADYFGIITIIAKREDCATVVLMTPVISLAS